MVLFGLKNQLSRGLPGARPMLCLTPVACARLGTIDPSFSCAISGPRGRCARLAARGAAQLCLCG